MVEGTAGEGLRGGDGGRGNLRVAKTPPLTVGVCGEDIKTSAPNKTTRRAASLRSSKNLNCVIEISLPVRRTSYKRLTPYGLFAAVPLLENGGFKQILPFLGGRSDAACRVVIWPSRPHLWEPMVFITPRWLGRALASGRATLGLPLQHLPYQEPY